MGPQKIDIFSASGRLKFLILHLHLHRDNEHRFNPITTISSILSLLQEAKSPPVLITTSHGRFFSNGFDLAWAQSSGANQFLIKFAVKFLSDTADIHPNRIRIEFGSSLKVRFCRWVLSKSSWVWVPWIDEALNRA
ncbi:unnamed protein product [Cochlearia groenlandica]